MYPVPVHYNIHFIAVRAVATAGLPKIYNNTEKAHQLRMYGLFASAFSLQFN